MRIYVNKSEIDWLLGKQDCPDSLREKLSREGPVYLTEVMNTSIGDSSRTYSIYDRPCRTNVSNEIRLKGRLGETNNITRYALGKFDSIKDALDDIDGEVEPIDEFDREDGLLWIGKVINVDELIDALFWELIQHRDEIPESWRERFPTYAEADNHKVEQMVADHGLAVEIRQSPKDWISAETGKIELDEVLHWME